MKIKLLPYDSCVKIGEKYFDKDSTFGLPSYVFDSILDVKKLEANNIYEAVSVDGTLAPMGSWYVPPVFVSYTLQ